MSALPGTSWIIAGKQRCFQLPPPALNFAKGFQRLLLGGLPHQRVHDLRDACASLLLAQGFQPRVAMELLGQSQLNTAMNISSHVIQDAQRDAAAKMYAVLSGEV